MNSIANFKCSVNHKILKKLSLLVDNIHDLSTTHPHEILIWNNNYLFTTRHLRAFPKLKLFINWGTTDHNIKAERTMIRRGIQIKKIDFYATEAVAEYVVGLLFNFERNIDRLLKQEKLIGTELRGKIVGIVGLGKVGFRIAQILKTSYFCKIYYTAKSNKQIPEFYFASVKKMLSECDYLILSAKSKTLSIDKRLLQWVNKNIVIVNISDDQILPFRYIKPLLRNDHVRGFIGDLENLSDRNILGLKNVLLTKHLGYLTFQAKQIKNNILIFFLKKYLTRKENKNLFIYIARHGQTVWNRQKIFQGSLDSPLSKKGRTITKRIGHYITSQNIQTIFSSPLKRARISAKIIASVTHKPHTVVPEFREMNFGVFEGKKQIIVKKVFESFFLLRDKNSYYRLYIPYPEGESYFDVYLRVLEKTMQLLSIYDQFLIVGHESVNRIIRGIVTERSLTDMTRLRQKNNEIVAINLSDNSEQIVHI